jgi:hypothetical protein
MPSTGATFCVISGAKLVGALMHCNICFFIHEHQSLVTHSIYTYNCITIIHTVSNQLKVEASES